MASIGRSAGVGVIGTLRRMRLEHRSLLQVATVVFEMIEVLCSFQVLAVQKRLDGEGGSPSVSCILISN